MKNLKNIISTIAKFLIAFGLIYWLVSTDKINFSSIKVILAPQYLMPSILLIAINIFIGSERWRFLLKRQGVLITRFNAFRLTLIGIFFNFAVPGGVGGDLIKGVEITRENPHAKSKTAFSVLMDRLIGLYAMVFIAAITMLIDIKHVLTVPVLKVLFVTIWIFVFAASFLFKLAFSQREIIHQNLTRIFDFLPFSGLTNKVYTILRSYGQNKSTFWYSVLMSLVAQTLVVFLFMIVGHALGQNQIETKTYFLVVPLGLISTALPISPAGVGVGQAAFIFLFSTYLGYQTEVGPTAITIQQVIMFFLGLSGAYFYVTRKKVEHSHES